MARDKKGSKVVGMTHADVLARQMKDPDFRFHYEQRKLVHEVALAMRGMRKQAGLTQAQLAKLVGVSQPMIARIEKGLEQRTPRWEMLGRICIALGKQMRLAFVDAEDLPEGPRVEVDGKPAAAMEDERAGVSTPTASS